MVVMRNTSDMKKLQLSTPNRCLAIVFATVTAVITCWHASLPFVVKPTFAQTMHPTLPNLASKIGATCVIHHAGAIPGNLPVGTLKAVSEQWIVIVPEKRDKTAETWIPVHAVQQIEFGPA